MSIDEMISVLQAAKQSKQIQARRHGYKDWHNCTDSPSWDFFSQDYRIAPEPREIYIPLRDDGSLDLPVCPADCRYAIFREVI